MTHRVYHVPNDPYYSAHAQAMTETDYAYLLAHTLAVTGRIYCLTGTFVSKIESQEADYYLFDAGEQGSPRNFIIENTTEANIKIGQVYKVYVDVEGTQIQNYPVLALRRTYWLLEQAGASASPGASSSPGASPTSGA